MFTVTNTPWISYQDHEICLFLITFNRVEYV